MNTGFGTLANTLRWLRLPLPPPDDETPGGPLAAETPLPSSRATGGSGTQRWRG